MRIRRTLRLTLVSLVAALGLVTWLAANATALNKGSVSGVHTTSCTVAWQAQTVMDTTLTNDDPTYPNLMVRPDGTPVDYTNGGYISEVRPEYGDPGLFEITHWYQGTSDGQTLANWRIPIATDHDIANATVTVRLPSGSGFQFTSGANIVRWGTPYSTYTWTNPAITPTTDASGLVWTIPLDDLAAGTGVVIQFTGPVDPAVTTEHQVATADLTGAYTLGDAPTCQAASPTPSPTSSAPVPPTTTAPSTPAPSTTSVQPTSTVSVEPTSTATNSDGSTASVSAEPTSTESSPAAPATTSGSTGPGTGGLPGTGDTAALSVAALVALVACGLLVRRRR